MKIKTLFTIGKFWLALLLLATLVCFWNGWLIVATVCLIGFALDLYAFIALFRRFS